MPGWKPSPREPPTTTTVPWPRGVYQGIDIPRSPKSTPFLATSQCDAMRRDADDEYPTQNRRRTIYAASPASLPCLVRADGATRLRRSAAPSANICRAAEIVSVKPNSQCLSHSAITFVKQSGLPKSAAQRILYFTRSDLRFCERQGASRRC